MAKEMQIKQKLITNRIFGIAGIILLFMLLSPFFFLLRYPRIVRSAYYKSPLLVYKAFYCEYLEKKAFSAKSAVEKVRINGLEVAGDLKYLFLADDTGIDGDVKIIDRYFSLISKWARPKSITSERFWHIPVQSGLVMFEVDTGRMVYYEKDERSDYSAPPVVLPERNLHFELPEKIIIYRQGKQTLVEKDTGLYEKIIEQANMRFKEPLDIAKLAVIAEDEKQIKNAETAVEFTYTGKVNSEFKGYKDRIIAREYSRILMPLTGNYSDLLFFGDNGRYHDGPLGRLGTADNLLNLVK